MLNVKGKYCKVERGVSVSVNAFLKSTYTDKGPWHTYNLLLKLRRGRQTDIAYCQQMQFHIADGVKSSLDKR